MNVSIPTQSEFLMMIFTLLFVFKKVIPNVVFGNFENIESGITKWSL